MSVEARFLEWTRSDDFKLVYAEVVRRARALRASGIRTYGIAGIWEAIRYDSSVGLLSGDEYVLNNSYRAYVARVVMVKERDLWGFFTTRALACERVPERAKA